MHVLVTGAGGFVGRQLVPYLLHQGCDVTAVSRRPQPSRPHCRWATTPRMDGSANWSPFLRGIDFVVHLAGSAHSRARSNSIAYQEELWRINVDSTGALYRDSSSHSISRFLFVSSVAALTSRSVGQLTIATPANPSTPYGKSKLAAERVLELSYCSGACPFTILRPPVIYGRGNPANMNRLMSLIVSGVPLPLKSLNNRRSFLYVGNLCDVVFRCLASPSVKNTTLLLSDGEDLSTPEFIRRIAAARNVPCRLFPFPQALLLFAARCNPDGALAKLTGSLYLDIEPLIQTLSWKPLFTVEEGLAQTFSNKYSEYG